MLPRRLPSLFLAALVATASCGDGEGAVPTAVVTRGELVVERAIHGELRAVESTVLVAPDFAYQVPEIARIAEHGDEVVAGDAVVEFDRAALESDILDAEAAVESANAKLEQLAGRRSLKLTEAAVSLQRAEMALDLAQMSRTDSPTVPLVDREAARVAEEQAKLSIEVARATQRTAALELDAERQLLELERDDRAAELDELNAVLPKATLRAPTDGVVLVLNDRAGRPWAAGTRPWGGTPLVELPDLTRMRVVAWAPEQDGVVLAAGQRAVVTLDAYPTERVGGTVDSVSAVAVPEGDEVTRFHEVSVTLDETLPHMLPGMSARVTVAVDAVADAAIVPLASLLTDADGPFLWRRALGRWARAHVAVGAQSATHATVDGVDEGDVVALVDPEAWDAEPRRPAARP
jgi:HlyD family secretion protein